MRPIFMKLVPVAIALGAALAVAACNPKGEQATVTGDELSSEFSAQAISTAPESYEAPLPPVDVPSMPDASNSAS